MLQQIKTFINIIMEKKQVAIRVYELSIQKIKKAQRVFAFKEDRKINMPDVLDMMLDKFLVEIDLVEKSPKGKLTL